MALEERSTRALLLVEETEAEGVRPPPPPPLLAFSAFATEEIGVVMVWEVLGVVGRIG